MAAPVVRGLRMVGRTRLVRTVALMAVPVAKVWRMVARTPAVATAVPTVVRTVEPVEAPEVGDDGAGSRTSAGRASGSPALRGG